MNFDKINFVLDILSSDKILSDSQNYLKLYVADSIAETPISTVEYKITQKDGRNAGVVIIDFNELTLNGAFYDSTFYPTLSNTSPLELLVRITDTSGNQYILKDKLEGVV